MVLYVEACESGSMFRNVLPKNMNIFVTTAASFNESSQACYFDESHGTCLGDWYSVNWMEDTDQHDISRETLYEQYLSVKKKTTSSHVMEFGDLAVARLPMADFQGEGPATKIQYPKVDPTPVPSYDVPLYILLNKLSMKHNSVENVAKYKKLVQERKFVEKVFSAIVSQLASNEQQARNWVDQRSIYEIKNLDCHTELVHSFSKTCFNFGKGPYALRYAHTLAHMCNDGVPIAAANIVFQNFCGRRGGKLLFRDGIH